MRTKEIQKMIKEGVFNSGVVLTRDEVQSLTKRARPTAKFKRKTIKDQMASNLLLVQFQHNVNKQLHTKGLHLRGENYTTSFRVLSRAETANTVDYYYSKANGAIDNAEALEAGRSRRRR